MKEKRTRRAGASLRLFLAGAPVVLVCLIFALAPIAVASAPFQKMFKAPFRGTDSAGLTQSFIGSGSGGVANASFFNMATGHGGFSASVAADSSNLANQRNGWGVSEGWLESTTYFYLQVGFNNHSGTRVLTSVNLSFNYALSGNITIVNGTCPWVKSIHNFNECERWVSAGASIFPEGLTNVHGAKNGPESTGSCVPSCDLGGAASLNESLNNSHGLKTYAIWNGSASFSSSGMMRISFPLAKPLHESETLLLRFVAYCGVYAYMTAKLGRGGLSGASESASINFATGGDGFALTSITEA